VSHASRRHPHRFVSCLLSALSLCVAASAAAPRDEEERERLLVLSADGEIVATLDGDAARVLITPQVDVLLRTSGAGLTLSHNHPRNGGLSGDDLQQLAKPGVARIAALARDGSRYEAAIGPAYDREHFLARQYAPVLDRLTRTRPARIAADVFDSYLAHLASLALHRARVIDYHVDLSNARVWPYHDYGVLFERVVIDAANELRR
jgi:hypothetical protein